jgi:hypothetical protein
MFVVCCLLNVYNPQREHARFSCYERDDGLRDVLK